MLLRRERHRPPGLPAAGGEAVSDDRRALVGRCYLIGPGYAKAAALSIGGDKLVKYGRTGGRPRAAVL
jgi:hypothetical protein